MQYIYNWRGSYEIIEHKSLLKWYTVERRITVIKLPNEILVQKI